MADSRPATAHTSHAGPTASSWLQWCAATVWCSFVAPRQVGKTSLLARGIHAALQQGINVVYTDFQKFNLSEFSSADSFYMTLGTGAARALGLKTRPRDVSGSLPRSELKLRGVCEGPSPPRHDTTVSLGDGRG